MRWLRRLSFVLAALPLLGLAQQTVVVTSSGGAGGLGLYSDGSAWPTNGGFTFEVGAFPLGYDPVSADRASWVSAWLPARSTTTAGVVNTWFRDGTSTYFSITGSSSALRPADLPAPLYYVWGYNTKALGTGTEWILLTNPAWKVVASTTPLLPDQFDTKDAGTIALVGRLSNGGVDLQSARITVTGISIAGLNANFTVPVGQPATLTVSATGTGLSYQWYAGDKGDVSNPIAGAVKPAYTVGSLTTTSRFWVRISDGVRTVDSNAVTVTAAGSGAVANSSHAVASLGYIAGQRVTIRNLISYPGSLSGLNVSALLPAGWSYLGAEISGVQSQPLSGKTDLLEWSWTTVPASPFVFTYMVAVPPETTGDQTISSLVTAVQSGVSYQGLAQSDPLVLKPGPQFHSADINRDSKISLPELLRVIDLYNTRAGNLRTGAYQVATGTEDGFAPNYQSAPAGVLAVYHTADNSPRDGRLNLEELTRVIELYNARVGTTRTGDYRARGDTLDGFVSGTAP